MGPVGQHGQYHEAQDHRRYTPDDVNPLPADQPEHGRIVSLADAHEPAGNGRTDDLGDRGADEKPGEHARSIAAGKPVRQVNNHARIKPSLGQAEQKSHAPELKDIGRTRPAQLADQPLNLCAQPSHVPPGQRLQHVGRGPNNPFGEVGRPGNPVMHERRHGRDDPPGDHDPADPLPCAPALDQEGAGNLQEQVSDEEDAHPEAEDAFGEPQVRQLSLHVQLGEADVHPIDIGDHIANEQKWQKSAVGLETCTVERAGGT